MKANTQRVGVHSFHTEDDVLFLQWVGDLLPEHVCAMQAGLESMLDGHSVVFLLVDAKAGGSVSPEARKRAATWAHAHRFGGAAVFGAGLTTRAAVTIASALQRLLFPQNKLSVEFTDTEHAARAWIDARRRIIQARARGA